MRLPLASRCLYKTMPSYWLESYHLLGAGSIKVRGHWNTSIGNSQTRYSLSGPSGGPRTQFVGHSLSHTPVFRDTLGDTPRDTSGPKGPRDSCGWSGSSQHFQTRTHPTLTSSCQYVQFFQECLPKIYKEVSVRIADGNFSGTFRKDWRS